MSAPEKFRKPKSGLFLLTSCDQPAKQGGKPKPKISHRLFVGLLDDRLQARYASVPELYDYRSGRLIAL
jgi:hypothetical protein